MRSPRTRAALLGGGAGLLLQTWLLTAGSWALFARRAGSDFFDAQSAAWLDGHWWVPREVVGLEGIVVDGRTQIYFGPLPALLRLPVAVFGGAPGRLSVVSMLLAAAVTIWAALRLLGQAQARWPPVGERGASVAAGAVAFLVPAGTTLAFVASRTLVYHEAAAWGTATALLALSFVVDAADRPGRRTLVLAVAATTACTLARVSVALGPVVALGLVVLLRLRATRRPSPLLLAPVVPVAAMAAVNFVRFGTLLSVPFQQQVQTLIDPSRPAFFAANGGGFFNLRFIPTTLFHYFQPAGVRPSGWFPFVEFPPPGRVIGSATFDLVDRTASAPATMPALVLLAVFGAVVVARRGTAGLRVAAIGGAAGVLPMLVFGYVAHRYLADVVPLVVVLGVCGLAALPAPTSPGRRVALAGLALLALAGVWGNVGLGILQQRLWGPLIDPAVVRTFVEDRLALDRRLGLAEPVVHRAADGLPPAVGAGEFVVLGDCEALYLETGVPVGILPLAHWRSLERTGRSVAVRADLRGAADGAVVARAGSGRLLLEARGDGEVGLVWDGPPERNEGPSVPRHRLGDVLLVADPHVDQLVVTAGDDVLVSSLYLDDQRLRLVAGEALPRPEPTLCRELLDQAGGAR